jgi:hypothetical protein
MSNMRLHSVACFLIRLRAFLAGKKTYGILTISLIYSIGIERGWWQSDLTAWTLLGSSVAVTIRATVIRILIQFLDDLTTRPQRLRRKSQIPNPKSLEKTSPISSHFCVPIFLAAWRFV